MSNPAKMFRSQMRQIIKEVLPEILTAELKSAIHQQLASEVQKRLDDVVKGAKTTLETMDQRSKDIQNYLIQQTTKSVAPLEVMPELDKK